jgi:hypothetical protein
MPEKIEKIELQVARESFENAEGCTDADRAAKNYLDVVINKAREWYPGVEVSGEVVQHAIGARQYFGTADGSNDMAESRQLAEELYSSIDFGDSRIWEGAV